MINTPIFTLHDIPVQLPNLPGFTLRAFQGEPDFPHMVRALLASETADGVERSETVEEITRSYQYLTKSDLSRDVVIAEVNGEVVGYSRVDKWREDDSGAWIYLHFGFLAPEWRGRGIGSAMVAYCVQRLAQIRAEQIAAGEVSPEDAAYLQSFAAQTAAPARSLLEEAGYTETRSFYEMVRPNLQDIPNLPLPEGIEVRPVQPEHLRAIWDAEVEAFRDHWGFSEPDEEDYAHWLDEVQNDDDINPALWRVAWCGEQVVGMVRSFIDAAGNAKFNRQRGYTEHISVRRPWRKHGVARALIALSLQALKDEGCTEAALGVDTQNLSGALRLYQSMGFVPVTRNITYRKLFPSP